MDEWDFLDLIKEVLVVTIIFVVQPPLIDLDGYRSHTQLRYLSCQKLNLQFGRQFQFWSCFKAAGRSCWSKTSSSLYVKQFRKVLTNPSCTSGISHLMIVIHILSVSVWSFLFFLNVVILTRLIALHPSIKLDYCKNNWDKKYYEAGYKAFGEAASREWHG